MLVLCVGRRCRLTIVKLQRKRVAGVDNEADLGTDLPDPVALVVVGIVVEV